MAVLHTLSAIGRFIRRAPPPPVELLEAYAHEVIPVLDRAEWLYTYWLEQSTLFTDSEKLGNVAAIHRWETATMGHSLERVIPPAVLAEAHERVIDALEMASRAAQLLSNGSRFHNANAVCEGQAMLTVSRERRLAALKSMRRYLSRVQLDKDAEAEATSAALAEAAALAAVQTAPEAAAEPAVTEATEWPELADLDVIVADPSEPEPAWLSAARASTPPEAETAAPSAAPAPPETTAPSEQAKDESWGSLFGPSPADRERKIRD